MQKPPISKVKIICNTSVFYLDKTVPKGRLNCEVGHLLRRNKYRIKVVNTINFKKSTTVCGL